MRLLVSAAITLVGLGFVVASAIPYGGVGGASISLLGFLVFFLIGWSFLPAVRWTRSVAVAFAVFWFSGVLYLVTLGAGAPRAWLALAILATCCILACLAVNPGALRRSSGTAQDGSRQKRDA
jgi:hypothetical protein